MFGGYPHTSYISEFPWVTRLAKIYLGCLHGNESVKIHDIKVILIPKDPSHRPAECLAVGLLCRVVS
jgi:hypothetical protein